MATLEFPMRDSLHVLQNETPQPGKNKIPFRLELSAEQYSNNAATRANGGSQLVKIILPPPTEGFGNAISHAYNQAPAKEESLLTKVFSGEATSLFRDALNFFGKQIQDARTTFLGQDFGRIPADMSESTYGGSDKRSFSFSWELVSLSKKDSDQIMKIADAMTSYSLPGAKNSSDRAQAPPMWRIKVLTSTGNGPGQLTKVMLGSPKACFLTNLAINRDISSLYGPGPGSSYPTPVSVTFRADFQEIEPVYGQDGNIRSRAEVRTGGGVFSAGSGGGGFLDT
jgi:hypothetical protein